MFELFINYLKTRRVVGAPCMYFPVAAAVGDRFPPADSAGDCSMGLYPSFPRGGTGADSDGMPLLSSAEAMLVFFSSMTDVLIPTQFLCMNASEGAGTNVVQKGLRAC